MLPALPYSSGCFVFLLFIKSSIADFISDLSPFLREKAAPTMIFSVPMIELKEYLIYTKKGKTIDFKTYIVDALTAKEESLKDKDTVESNVDFNKEGTYQVHFYATDSEGQRGHSVMTVVVGG